MLPSKKIDTILALIAVGFAVPAVWAQDSDATPATPTQPRAEGEPPAAAASHAPAGWCR